MLRARDGPRVGSRDGRGACGPRLNVFPKRRGVDTSTSDGARFHPCLRMMSGLRVAQSARYSTRATARIMLSWNCTWCADLRPPGSCGRRRPAVARARDGAGGSRPFEAVFVDHVEQLVQGANGGVARQLFSRLRHPKGRAHVGRLLVRWVVDRVLERDQRATAARRVAHALRVRVKLHQNRAVEEAVHSGRSILRYSTTRHARTHAAT